MSVSSADLAIPIGNKYAMVLLAVGSAAIIYFSTLKVLFGTFSINKVLNDYKKQNFYSERYEELFQTRDSCIYHIHWAKSRGDESEMASLIEDLKRIDQVCYARY
jgi:hypothetical protein